MDRASYLVDAVVVDHRSLRTVARTHGVSKSIENVIITLRKELCDSGLDAGLTTIFCISNNNNNNITPPSVFTIWRTLTRRGFITPQPKKRPHTPDAEILPTNTSLSPMPTVGAPSGDTERNAGHLKAMGWYAPKHG